LAAGLGACGDLVIPTNEAGADDEGGTSEEGGTSGDGSTSGDGGTSEELDCTTDAGHPVQLGCTGLYSNWSTREISADAKPFDPGLHLWSDGAEKFRYIYLPPGQKIDTSDPNEWKFPVGTKIWKEFRLLGKKIETRFIWKVSPITWFRTTYEWSDDESSATELVGGRQNVRGVGYEIPASDQCATCHAGREDFVLGFEQVSLGQATATGLNLAALKTQNLLTKPPTANPVIPGDANGSKAVAFLHANCGTGCHNRSPSAFAGATGLFMRLDVDANGALPASITATDTWTTAVNVVSTFTPQGEPAGSFMRIKPRDLTHSAIPYRDGRRDGVVQMPPLATHLVDFEDLKVVQDWISAM
jgi:hypothetical protein